MTAGEPLHHHSMEFRQHFFLPQPLSIQATMKRKLFAILGIGMLFLPAAMQASAQEPHHPQISIGHQGVNRLKSDLKALLSLTSEKDQEQLPNLVDFVDLMAYGLDPDKPVSVELLTGMAPLPYVISAAYKNDPAFEVPGDAPFAQLLDNLGANFYPQKAGNDWWEFLPPDQGWLRLVPDKQIFRTPGFPGSDE